MRSSTVAGSLIQTAMGLVAGLRGQAPIIDGAFHARVRADDCLWQLQDGHRLIITLQKLVIEKHEWWPRLMQGEPEINIDDCDTAQSTGHLLKLHFFCSLSEGQALPP